MHQVKRGFSLVELLVVIVIIGIMLGLVLPAVQASRESARSAECKNNLRMLGMATLKFHERNGNLPTYDGAFPPNAATRLMAGWFVHILPDLDQQVLYDQILQGTAGSRVVVGRQQVFLYNVPPSADYKAAWTEYKGLPDAQEWIPAVYDYFPPSADYSCTPEQGYWIEEQGYWETIPGYVEVVDYRSEHNGHTAGNVYSEEHPPGQRWVVTAPRTWVRTVAASCTGTAGYYVLRTPAQYIGQPDIFHPQVGTPGYPVYGEIGGQETIEPTGGNIPFSVLVCNSDPSDVRPLQLRYSGRRRGTWSLTNYLANVHAFTAQNRVPGPYGYGGQIWAYVEDPTPASATDPRYICTNQGTPEYDANGNLFWAAFPRYVEASPGDPQPWYRKEYQEQTPSSLSFIKDGPSNTILFAEAMRECDYTARFAFWPQWLPAPEDQFPNTHNFGVDWDGYLNTFMFQTGARNMTCNNWIVQGLHGRALNCAMADGSVRTISNTISRRQRSNADTMIFGMNAVMGEKNGTWDYLLLPADQKVITEQW